MATDTGNPIFQLAVQFVNQTGRSIFLTGKAGTGKTTFLRHIRQHSLKKMAVVAPTGVAAINAGGTTLHSMFQLPFGPFIPQPLRGWNSSPGASSDPNSLLANLRLTSTKRQLIQELELLIIDEISMVRADTLDAVDTILRHFRNQPRMPFGGVQLLYIGDLYQLPPVVSKEEWELLQPYYKSPFFFDAQVLRDNPPLCIELKKIYRQNEVKFINILNNIRNNQAGYEDLEKLHDYYQPEFIAPRNENYITLTSHNAVAESINQEALQKLRGSVFTFEAAVSGEFSDKAYPADKTLTLKEGAQIMLIKNDKGESRRYFNGKIGIIAAITDDKIVIEFPDEPDPLPLEKETWKNVRYHFNAEKDKIEEEELGTFSQYPIRLAWAITIHKSQGLTFTKAVIDAGRSFAPGQVYVALSRLVSLDGLVLRSRIQPHSISTDPRVVEFSQTMVNEDVVMEYLETEQKHFIGQTLLLNFSWDKLVDTLRNFFEERDQRQTPDKMEDYILAKNLVEKVQAQAQTAAKFCRQLEQLLPEAARDGYEQLAQRMQAATGFFLPAVDNDLLQPLKTYIGEVRTKTKTKKYTNTLLLLHAAIARKRQQLEDSLQLVNGLQKGVDASSLLQTMQESKTSIPTTTADPATAKPTKGETNLITLQMFKEGLGIAEIATKRGLALSTVESHLAAFILTGELEVTELVSENKLGPITAALKEIGGTALGPIKAKLGDRASFGEIRAVMNHLRRGTQS